jgi:hypothetical protein
MLKYENRNTCSKPMKVFSTAAEADAQTKRYHTEECGYAPLVFTNIGQVERNVLNFHYIWYI